MQFARGRFPNCLQQKYIISATLMQLILRGLIAISGFIFIPFETFLQLSPLGKRIGAISAKRKTPARKNVMRRHKKSLGSAQARRRASPPDFRSSHF